MSDTSQGEGWWIASDDKWYPPETHPDYVAPEPAVSEPAAPDAGQTVIKGSDLPQDVAETIAIRPSVDQTPFTAPSTPVSSQPTSAMPSASAPGPSVANAETTATMPPSQPMADPQFDLSSTGTNDNASSKRGLILGIGAVVLVAVLGFFAFRFFTGGSSGGGASSPEAAIGQLISSINEKDAVGFVEVFDPDEIDAWFGSFSSAFDGFDQAETAGAGNELTEVYKTIFDSFGYTLTGPGGEDPTYEVLPLDDDGRVARVRINGLDFSIMVGDTDTALITAFAGDPTGLDLRQADGVSVELRDEPTGLGAMLLRPGFPNEDTFGPDAHLDVVTVEKDGNWYISVGYTMLESARSQDAFPGSTSPDFGRAFRLVDEQTGGAESAEEAVRQMFTALEGLDYDLALRLMDPYATPYLHDYQPLIDEQVDERSRREAASDMQLQFDEIGLTVSEWKGRTVVEFGTISGGVGQSQFTLDAQTWCATIEDGGNSDRGCLDDVISEGLRSIDSFEDPRNFLPERAGMVVVERNGRWYVDALGTFGFFTDQVADSLVTLSEEFGGDPLNEFGGLFFAEGPVARQGAPATRLAQSGQVAVAMDLAGYPLIGNDFDSVHVALARIVATEPGNYVAFWPRELDGEDWIIAYDRIDESDTTYPAVAAQTDGQLDVELFEPQITTVGGEGFSGQLGGEGRPQVLVFDEEIRDYDIQITGVDAETVYPWDGNGTILPSRDLLGSGYVTGGLFTVIYGEPGAPFDVEVIAFGQPDSNDTDSGDTQPDDSDGDDFGDPSGNGAVLDLFSAYVDAYGYFETSSQPGGFFDGCGPDDPDVTSHLFEDSSFELIVLTPYPDVGRAQRAFDDLLEVASPCAGFDNVEVRSVDLIDSQNILIEWTFVDDPGVTNYEHYRLSNNVVVVATGSTIDQIEAKLEFLNNW